MASKKSKLNPKLIIIAVIVLILLGVGAYFMMGKKGMDYNAMESEGSNAISSIKDALSKSVSMNCEFTDSMGRVSKVSIKNGAVRGEFTGTGTEESGNMILRDNKMYVWNNGQGFMMEIPEGEWDNAMNGEGEAGDYLKELEQYKDSCKPAVVSDSIFTVPTDVTFTDYSKMMQPSGNQMTEEDVKKMMEQYQDQ